MLPDYESSVNVIAKNVDGLKIDTVYYVKAYVTNSYGTFTSNTFEFRTQKVEYDFGSVGLNNIGYESVTASYSIEIISNPLNTIEKGVEVATNNSFYNSRLVIDYSQDNNSSVNVTGLDFNTSYFVDHLSRMNTEFFTVNIQSLKH